MLNHSSSTEKRVPQVKDLAITSANNDTPVRAIKAAEDGATKENGDQVTKGLHNKTPITKGEWNVGKVKSKIPSLP